MNNLIQIERVGVPLEDLRYLIDYWRRISSQNGLVNEVGVGLKMAATQLEVLIRTHSRWTGEDDKFFQCPKCGTEHFYLNHPPEKCDVCGELFKQEGDDL